MDENDAVDVLRKIKTVFDKYGIVFWLNSGTLLGAVRDGRLIPWDNDIDLVCWQENASKLYAGTPVYKELRSGGLELFFLDDKIVIEKEGCPANLALFRLTDNKAVRGPYPAYKNSMGKFFRSLWWVLTVSYYEKVRFDRIQNINSAKILLVKFSQLLPQWLRKKLSEKMRTLALKFGCEEIFWAIPSNFFTTLSTIKLYGMEFKVPSRTEDYLEFRFGKDWRIVQRDWNTVKDDRGLLQPN